MLRLDEFQFWIFTWCCLMSIGTSWRN